MPETPKDIPPIDADQRIGLNPPPWTDDRAWPTYGYDGHLSQSDWNYEGNTPSIVQESGHTRAQWIALADTMIARWTAYRAHLSALPPDSP